jgi:hypothetical protein
MDGNSTHTVRLGKHVITREPLRHSSRHLFVSLRVAGPEASEWAIEEHLVLLVEGYDEKLQWQEGTGGPEPDGTWFQVKRYGWHGGDTVRICYFDDDEMVDEELVTLGPPDPHAAAAAVEGQQFVFVSEDWFDTSP